MWEWLMSIFLYPVKWFWTKFQDYSQKNNYIMIIVMFAVSLSGSLLSVFFIQWLVRYAVENYLSTLIVMGVIVWLYIYVKDSHSTKPEDPEPGPVRNEQPLIEKAEKEYPVIRNILFQVMKDTAADIGGTCPRLLGEIEIPEHHYIIANGVCFHQFKLSKVNIGELFNIHDLSQFKLIIQDAVTRMIAAGYFPYLVMEKYRDTYGTWHDGVVIDTIEDLGNMFFIHAVFASPEYAEYLHQKLIKSQGANDSTRPPDAQWGS